MAKFERMTTIYRNLTTGTYYVQPYTRGPVAATEFGDSTVIHSTEFEENIADAILENIERFGTERYEKARAIRRDDDGQRAFLKEHVGVGVSEHASGGLVVHSLHREKGGMVGSNEDVFLVSKEEIPQKLTATVAEAFKRAT